MLPIPLVRYVAAKIMIISELRRMAVPVRLLILLAILLSYAQLGFAGEIPLEEMQLLQRQHLPKIEKPIVNVVKRNGVDYYLIGAVTYKLFKNDDNESAQRKLDLLGKSALLNFVLGSDKSPAQMTLRGFRRALFWQDEGKYYSVMYVEKAAVSISRGLLIGQKGSGGEDVSLKSVRENAIAEITRLKKFINENPSSLGAYRSLYDLYFQIGDLEGADAAMDKIMDLTFRE